MRTAIPCDDEESSDHHNQSAFSAYAWSSEETIFPQLFSWMDLKPLLWVQSKIQNFCRISSEGIHICTRIWTSSGKTERWRNLSGEFDQRGRGWTPVCYRMGHFKQQQESFTFSCLLARDSPNAGHIKAGRFKSSVWNFWPRIADFSLCTWVEVISFREVRNYRGPAEGWHRS